MRIFYGLSGTVAVSQSMAHAGTSFAFAFSGDLDRRFPGSGYASPSARSGTSNGLV